jgi:hypothetical protein
MDIYQEYSSFQDLNTYYFPGDAGKCNMGLTILGDFKGSMDEDNFFGLPGEVGFNNAESESRYLRSLVCGGDCEASLII